MSNEDEKIIAEQLAFVQWLKDNGMYDQFESGTAMQKMHNVWVKMNQQIQPALAVLKNNVEDTRMMSVHNPGLISGAEYRQLCLNSVTMVETIQTNMDSRLDPYDDDVIRPTWEQ